MVIIYANFVVLLFKMIHIMFQGNRHRSSGEEDFLPYGGHLGCVIWTKRMNFLFPFRRSSLKILTNSRHVHDRWLRSLNNLSL